MSRNKVLEAPLVGRNWQLCSAVCGGPWFSVCCAVFVLVLLDAQNCSILNWNVRGLNNSARRKVVSELARDTSCTIACLQETKLQQVDSAVVSETLGSDFIQNFAFLPADGTRGGILLAVHASYFRILLTVCTSNTISALIQSNCVPSEWWITVVYGPQIESGKLAFLQELKQIGVFTGDKWLIIGDFSLTINVEDKSNNNVNHMLMGAFRTVLNDLELKELPLKGRKYTWTNSRTHTRIDRAFCSND